MSTCRIAAIVALVLAGAPVACFKDEGPYGIADLTGEPTAATSSFGEPTSAASTSAPTTSTGAPTTADVPPSCGDGQVDPGEGCDDGNRDDGDSCRNSCEPAACGDGVVWQGVEECDDGPGNHPTEPGACRPGCVAPKCGDGALYVGPLGPDVVIASGVDLTQSDDAPRAIGVDAQGVFSVIYRDGEQIDRVYVQTIAADGSLDGAPLDLTDPAALILSDPVIAVAPGGDFALAWEVNSNDGDLIVRGVVAGVAGPGFNALDVKSPVQRSPAIALDDLGRLTLAYVTTTGFLAFGVQARRIDNFDSSSPSEFVVSDIASGLPSAPSVAALPDGGFVVAWGPSDGPILFRRFGVDATPGAIVTTALRTGGLASGGDTSAWSGLAVLPDGDLILAGVGDDGLVSLQRFDVADEPQAPVAVSEAPRLHAPFIDLGVDAAGDLAVAWAECGEPGDGLATCEQVASDLRLRWLRADLSAHTDVTTIYSRPQGAPPPLGLAMAPSGATAVTYVADGSVLVRVAALECPTPP